MNGHLLVISHNDKETSQRLVGISQQNEIRKLKIHQISLNYFYTLKSITISRGSERNK